VKKKEHISRYWALYAVAYWATVITAIIIAQEA